MRPSRGSGPRTSAAAQADSMVIRSPCWPRRSRWTTFGACRRLSQRRKMLRKSWLNLPAMDKERSSGYGAAGIDLSLGPSA